MPSRERSVVFDLGGVLIDWNPRYLFRKLLPDEAAVEAFLTEVCSPAWNEQQDAGRTIADATRALVEQHPDRADLIRAYYDRWEEMLGGTIAGTERLVEELHDRGVPLYALSNWSAETFHHALDRYPILGRFRAIVVSGHEGVIKPDPRIFHLLRDRHGVDLARAVFIDDVARNVDAARALGMEGILFRSPEQLRAELAAQSWYSS